MIEKVSGGVEQMFEKEVAQPVRKERFTIKSKEAEKVRLQAEIDAIQAQIDAIDADIAEALEIKEV